MEKNTAGKWIVFAYGLPDHANPGQAITGDAANITANIRIDGGAANAVDDVNPAELEDGYYVFDITSVEANGDLLSIHPASATANVQVIGVPGAVWTRPPNFNALGIASDGDISGNIDGTVATVTTLTGHTAQTGDSFARLGAPAGASVSADVAAVKVDTAAILVDTAEIGAAGAGLTDLGGMSTAMKAEVNTEADSALTDIGLDHLLGASVAGTDITDDSIVAQLVSASATADWDDFVNTTDSLQALRDRGDSAWTTGAGGTPPQLLQNTTIATLSTQTSFTLTAGSADNDAYNGAVVVVTDSATATQKAVGSVSDYVGSTKTITLTSDPAIFTMAAGDTIDIIANASTAPTAAAVADAVWDEAQADHTSAGSFGEVATEVASVLADTAEIGAAGAGLTAVPWNASWDAEVQSECTDALNAYDPPTRAELTSDIASLNDPTAAAIADAVWDETQAAHVTAGTFGILATEIATIDTVVDGIQTDLDNGTDGLGAIKADTAAILVDTADMQPKLGTPAADISADIAAVKVDTAAILIDTNELQGDWTDGGRLDLIIDAILADTGTDGVILTSAERNSIADAILDRDMSTGTDSGSATVRTVRQALRTGRNKVGISGGTLTVYKEDDATASWTAAVTTTAGNPISDIDPAGP